MLWASLVEFFARRGFLAQAPRNGMLTAGAGSMFGDAAKLLFTRHPKEAGAGTGAAYLFNAYRFTRASWCIYLYGAGTGAAYFCLGWKFEENSSYLRRSD